MSIKVEMSGNVEIENMAVAETIETLNQKTQPAEKNEEVLKLLKKLSSSIQDIQISIGEQPDLKLLEDEINKIKKGDSEPNVFEKISKILNSFLDGTSKTIKVIDQATESQALKLATNQLIETSNKIINYL